jgi:hypothetical protein
VSRNAKVNLLKYGITIAASAAIAWFYISQRDFENQSLMERYRILCDAFTMPGVLLVMFGFLLAISNDGFFIGLAYCADVTIKSLTPGGRLKIKKYFDFVQERKGKKVMGFGFLFVVGGVCLAAAIVFMILFYRLYP